ncbi:MAG: response regulator [Magnetococcales bacterium]|nr:response regulator [Magnetococcales bacterium]
MRDTIRPKILLVEDEQHNIVVLGSALRHLYQVNVATSGEQALEKLATPPYPDMILLDIVMPGISGFAVCQSLKRNPGTADIPIIFITAKDSEADETMGFDLGAVDFISKPIRPAIVSARVQTHLAIQAKNREIAKGGALLRATLESTRDSILSIGSHGEITHFNDNFSRLFTLSPDTLLQGDGDRLLAEISTQLNNPHIFQKKWAQPHPRSAAEGGILYCKDGRAIACYSVPLQQQGAVVGQVWNFSDVTQQKFYESQLLQARQAAEAANEAKSTFLASMSHEIRTPLNGILGMAELLMDIGLPAPGQEYTQTILNSGRALMAIINDILDYSKMEAGKLQLESIPFSLYQLLRDLTILFGELARKQSIQFEQQLDRRLPDWLLGDPTRLRQILVNLLSNAVKFTKRGKVTLTAVPIMDPNKGTVVQFEVRDTGIGIRPEQFAKIFQSFEQADSSTTRQYGGTGLGLAIAQRLVHLLNGEIEVESREQVGSLFRVVLPCQSCAAPQQQPATAPLHALQHLPLGAKILVAEDDPINQAVIQGMLKRFALQVDFASQGRQAMAMLTDRAYDLVLLDCQMPEMDGYAVCRAFRDLERYRGRHTPVVALTAFAMQGDREKCLAAGMDDYLPKPISQQEIHSTLLRWLSGKPAPQSDPTRPDPAPPPILDHAMFRLHAASLGADFEKVITQFLQLLPQRIQAIQRALENNHPNEMARVAHALRGSSSQMGAISLAQCACTLETIALQRSLHGAEAWIPILENEQTRLINAIVTERRLAHFLQDLGDADFKVFIQMASKSVIELTQRIQDGIHRGKRQQVKEAATELTGIAGSYGLAEVEHSAAEIKAWQGKGALQTIHPRLEALQTAVQRTVALLDTY